MNNHFEINKLSNVPIYIQLKDSIKNAILNGIYAEGSKLPTEEFLCDFYNISRPVVRRSYQVLIDEGLIMSHQGKGTFVKRNLILSNILFRNDYYDYLRRLNFTPSNMLMILDIVNKNDIYILVDEKHDSYFNIKRMRLANHIPIAYECYYFPKEFFSNLTQQISADMIFTDYINKVLALDFPEKHIHHSMFINVVQADDTLITLFDCDKEDAMFKLTNIARFDDQTLLYLKISYFPGYYHKFEMRAGK